MPDPVARKIYRIGLICLALGICSVAVPGMVPGRGGGFSGVAEALLMLLAFLLAGLFLSVYLMVYTWRNYRGTSSLPRLVGFFPGVLYLGVIVWLFWFLGY